MRSEITASVGRNGRNRPRDVDTIRHLVSLNRRRSGVSAIEGFKKDKHWNKDDRKLKQAAWDEDFFLAIEEYQRSALGDPMPNGTIEPRSLEIAQLKASLGSYKTHQTYDEPAWLAIAAGELGVKEHRGLDDNNTRILEYLETAPHLAKTAYKQGKSESGHMMSEVDETAWCACFVRWCLTQANVNVGRRFSAKAEAWKNFGDETTPKQGAIAIIHRTPFADTSTGWHVGFYIGGPPDAPALLGGNQDNKVGYSQYYDLKNHYYRWPSA